MSRPARIDPSLRAVGARPAPGGPARDTLADVLERVLDKGVVIVGDVVVSILDIDLLTLKLRLFISSADTAREMGLDWWRNDRFFGGQDDTDGKQELEQLRARVAELEARLPDGSRDQDGSRNQDGSREEEPS